MTVTPELKMKFVVHIVALATAAMLGPAALAEPAGTCPPPAGVALQILGSGGPIADDGRASSGYLVWINGKSRILIDAGGGIFLRFGEANARFNDLEFIGLSHFHADHSADFVALLKSGNFSGRERSMRIAGPAGAGLFPGLTGYLDGMLNGGDGVYRYLQGYLDGSRGLAKLDPVEVDAERAVVYQDEPRSVMIEAVPVPHGIVPALGFKVRIGEVTIVFSSDQNGSNASFVTFAKDATALVMHLPIPEGATGGALQLHAKPSRIAEIAEAAGADRLILSHFMPRSLKNLQANAGIVRAGYTGPVVLANDLDCLTLRP
jgi:ribonuclease BN (tRNA processing enzyme)